MKNCYVKDYGAAGDGVTLDTKAIQAAIDDCAAHHGGQVILEAGTFLSARIDLKSGVELHIERDAVLLGSANGFDFEHIKTEFWRTEYAPRFNDRCFIYAEGCENIAITGMGVIDCQGRAYVDPLPEDKLGLMSYVRKPYPIDETESGESAPDVMFGTYAHPLDPRKTSLAPARVVLFIGCRNVLIEDITMRNQPAGWSYWICDCDNVHAHRAKILADVDMPNNDGLHINCCRNVTISDCDIVTGDDCIVVRAYSAPLHEHKACEKVTVTNCNLVSHTCAIRLGWINDGVIRDCTFSNLTVTESRNGFLAVLPSNPNELRISDQGDEATFIDNISFDNVVMDRMYGAPVSIQIKEHNLCKGIRNIHFSGLHCRSIRMPIVTGRDDCHVQNIDFNNCQFEQITYDDIGNRFSQRLAAKPQEPSMPVFSCVDNLTMNGTTFSVR